MKTNRRIVGLAIIFSLLMGLMALRAVQAATLEIPIESHGTIDDGEGDTRILIKFGDLSSLNGKKILYAKCYLNIDVDTCVDRLNELEVKPITKAWSAGGVDWMGQWDKPGGDANEALSSTVDFRRGRNGHTEIQLTEIVQAWIDERMANNGLLLVPRMKGCGYKVAYDATSTGTNLGKMIVRYLPNTR